MKLTINIPTAAEISALSSADFAAGFIANGETSFLYRDRAGSDLAAAEAVAAVLSALPEPAMRERHAKRLRDAIDYCRKNGKGGGFRLAEKDGAYTIKPVDADAEAKRATKREAAAAIRKAQREADAAESAAAIGDRDAARAALATVTAERDALAAELAKVQAERDALVVTLAERDAALAALAKPVRKPARRAA